LDRIDEIGDQVGPALVLVEHLRPCRAGGFVGGLDRVVAAAAEQADRQEQAGQPEQYSSCHQLPLLRSLAARASRAGSRSESSATKRAPSCARRTVAACIARGCTKEGSCPAAIGEALAELREFWRDHHSAIALRRV